MANKLTKREVINMMLAEESISANEVDVETSKFAEFDEENVILRKQIEN